MSEGGGEMSEGGGEMGEGGREHLYIVPPLPDC